MANAQNPHYLQLRNAAIREGDLMGKAFDESKRAYNGGDGARAKELSNEGHEHQREKERLNDEAALWIYTENNKRQPEGTIDLHGLYVQESIEYTEKAIESARSHSVPTLRVIVGKGNHSANHVAKIKPAIESLMQRQNLSAHLDPKNSGVLVISLQGGGGGSRDVVGDMERNNGYIPDVLVRPAIRVLCHQRLKEIASESVEERVEGKWRYIRDLEKRDVAEEQGKANEQHYEVSTPFIVSCLGPQLKYSCCLYPSPSTTLAEAEVLMMESYCLKAKLEDGMKVLDLGCGWGSLTLFLAEKYPNSQITSLSNSSTQKTHIDSQAALRGLRNVEVFTGDVMEFDFKGTREFDRILSIEMFEHMKNYESLLGKISTWLKPNDKAKGKDGSLLFVHIFCHKDTPYHFEQNDGWMSQNFFSGGTMPSFDLFTYFQRDLTLQRSWWINGKHYARTSEDWLKVQDGNSEIWKGKEDKLVEGKDGGTVEERRREGRKSFFKFRIFFIAVAEFFALNDGESWGVGHYLFRKRD
ncbi:S-adenosyl-L-methionine-dependent methyltransferase [Pseudohyphozyma bogoriensis]|nr:S-adenosyl-L-methionine-dependent methyltransferase [Pseudohyphozyma bogoriensis]